MSTNQPPPDDTPNTSAQEVLEQLNQVINSRKSADANDSYVASLFNKGLNKILEKVGEEAVELIIASKSYEQTPQPEQRAEVIYETADLWFHVLIALSQLGIDSDEVFSELTRRFGQSGIDEKASRPQS